MRGASLEASQTLALARTPAGGDQGSRAAPEERGAKGGSGGFAPGASCLGVGHLSEHSECLWLRSSGSFPDTEQKDRRQGDLWLEWERIPDWTQRKKEEKEIL